MIPPDVANSLRQILPDSHSATTAQTRPLLPAQRIADILGNLVPGQRLLAEVQALLPNGSYRAVVAQRDITLALPFSAKPGDSLELEVVETDGKVALAFVANRSASPQASGNESVATTLSQTGKLIGDLLGDIDNQGKRAPPAALNGSRPLVEHMPTTAADLAPVLKQALSQSGMFYEAHQARWVAGELPTSRLLQEPQGQFSQPQALAGHAAGTTTAAALAGHQLPPGSATTVPPPVTIGATSPGTGEPIAPGSQQTVPTAQAAEKSPTTQPNPSATSTTSAAAEALPAQGTRAEMAYARQAMLGDQAELGSRQEQIANRSTASGPMAPIPQALNPLVQQQLDALATQTFAWQGQIWPGQQMFWEIDEQQGNRRQGGNEAGGQWQTRLKLALPQLGGIDASLRLLPGNEIEIALQVEQGASEARLDSAGQLLKSQFAAAGLNLTRLAVKHGSPTE